MNKAELVFEIENIVISLFNECKTKTELKNSCDVINETILRQCNIRCGKIDSDKHQTQEAMQKHIECLEAELKGLKSELKITREYLHNNGLEWGLLSYSIKKEMVGDQCST